MFCCSFKTTITTTAQASVVVVIDTFKQNNWCRKNHTSKDNKDLNEKYGPNFLQLNVCCVCVWFFFAPSFEGADLNLSLLLVFPFLFVEIIIIQITSVYLIRLCIFKLALIKHFKIELLFGYKSCMNVCSRVKRF